MGTYSVLPCPISYFAERIDYNSRYRNVPLSGYPDIQNIFLDIYGEKRPSPLFMSSDGTIKAYDYGRFTLLDGAIPDYQKQEFKFDADKFSCQHFATGLSNDIFVCYKTFCAYLRSYAELTPISAIKVYSSDLGCVYEEKDISTGNIKHTDDVGTILSEEKFALRKIKCIGAIDQYRDNDTVAISYNKQICHIMSDYANIANDLIEITVLSV